MNKTKSKTVKYEVIADFPASMFDVGHIISVYESNGVAYVAEIDDNSVKVDVRDFPYLFKLVLDEPTNE